MATVKSPGSIAKRWTRKSTHDRGEQKQPTPVELGTGPHSSEDAVPGVGSKP